MTFIWALVAMPILVLLFTAFVTAREKPGYLLDSVGSFSKHLCLKQGSGQEFCSGRREVRWLSTQELNRIIFPPDDVIFIDVRPSNETGSSPHAAKHVLFITPDRLISILRVLPPETSAVLYGVSDLSRSRTLNIPTLTGRASIYVLTDTPMYAEAAR